VFGRDDVTFLGVFDGTVGDNAAEFVHLNIVDHICGHPVRARRARARACARGRARGRSRGAFAEHCGSSPLCPLAYQRADNRTPTCTPPPPPQAFKDAVAAAGSAPGGFTAPGVVSSIEAALREGYQATDTGLIALCREAQIHYSACTSVTALLTGDLLSLAHLGDSKIVLGREEGGAPGSGGALLVGQYLTTDHKPDMALERRRIEEVRAARGRASQRGRCSSSGSVATSLSQHATLRIQMHPPTLTLKPVPLQSGGSLAYLHGGKPFIRGGDFTVRQQRGERPMQLNYSRAFGGKDLKMYGLSCLPDICQVQLTPQDK